MSQNWPRRTAVRALKPALNVLDRRIERLARKRARQVVSESRTFRDLKSESEQLRTELDKLRTEINGVKATGYAVDLLLGPHGRRSSRLMSQAR